MKPKSFSEKSAKTIGKRYLFIVKCSKLFRLIMPVFVLFLFARALTSDISGMASLSLANAYYSIGDFKNARRVLDRTVIQGSKSQQLILETFFDAVNFNICAAQKDLSSCNMS